MSKNRHSTIAFGKGKQRLVLFHLNKPLTGGLIGMVRSKLFPEPVGVIIDDTQADDKEYTFACIACTKDGKAPRIMIEREFFYDITRGSIEARTILLHELGHYHHQHLLERIEDREKLRGDCTAAGYVDSKELEADRFVADILGRDKAIAGLQKLIDRIRTEYTDYDQESVQLATEELRLRIAALEKE